MIVKYLNSIRHRSKNHSGLKLNQQEAIRSYCEENDLMVLYTTFSNGYIDIDRFIELVVAAMPKDAVFKRQKGVITHSYSYGYYKVQVNRKDLLEKIKQVIQYKKGLELFMEGDSYQLLPIDTVVKIHMDLILINDYLKISKTEILKMG